MNSILLNSLINRDIEKELISVLRIKIESRRNGRTDSWKIVNKLLKKKENRGKFVVLSKKSATE